MVNAGKIEGIRKSLSGYSRIKVADYQRNYDWGRSEIDELWSDLVQAIKDEREHFFGSLIIQDTDEESCELVDGQQRITTLFLFLARLRDSLQTFGETKLKAKSSKERDIDVESPILDFLYGERNASTTPRYEANALLLKLASHAYSPLDEEGVDRDIPKRSRDIDKAATLPFRNAYWQVKELIEGDLNNFESNDSKLNRINEISSAFLERLKVLPITTGNLEESLNVFMTINDRGLPLGVFDLVRGQVLKALTVNLPEEKKKQVFVETLSEWEEILENVEGAKPDQFLRHYLLSTRSEKATMKSVPAAVGNLIDMNSSGFDSRAADFWQKIQISSEVYDQILRPVIKGKAKQHLECLHLIADSYRVLALRILHQEAGLSESEKSELIRLLFVAVFRWNIEGRNAQELEGELQKACKPLWSLGGFKETKEMLSNIANQSSDIRRFFENGVSVQWAKALLLALEAEISGKAEGLNVSKLHVEHVAPQKANKHWSTVLANDARSYSELINDIGNLTILDSGLNQEIKRDSFTKKAQAYKKSRSNLTNDLANLKTWDSAMIELRQEWIINSLENLLDVRNTPIKLFSEWLDSRKP